ncbi:MAG: metallophosphoesterase family protein [bacterium]|nr:metallophosphoesterase family protein [bacterium]
MSELIGLISDTHGLLRPQAIEALRGVDRILHAGDVGRDGILDELVELAPLVAVRGNVDSGRRAGALPETEEIEVGGCWLHMRHIVDDLDLDPRAAGFAAVIYGHSHQPSVERRDGVLFVNPGSAGPRRFSLPVTVARLVVDSGEIEATIVDLEL